MLVQFNSVQLEMVSVRSEKPIRCAPPRLRMLVMELSEFHFFFAYSSVVGVGCGANHFILNYYEVFLIGKVAVLTYSNL